MRCGKWFARSRRALVLASCAALLLWPAFYNRIPLLYYDSAAYILPKGAWGTHLRPLPYTVFSWLTSLCFSSWITVAVQSLLTVWVVVTAATVALADDRPKGPELAEAREPPLGIGATVSLMGLCALSSLPDYVSLIMPDLFAPLGGLALYVVLCGKRWHAVVGASVVLAAAAAVHSSHPLIFGAVTSLWVVAGRWRRVLLALGAALAGVLLSTTLNWAFSEHFLMEQYGSTLVFARMVGDDLIRPVLERDCGTRASPFCPYTSELAGMTPDQYVWSEAPNALRWRVGPHRAEEERVLALASLREFPWLNARAALQDTWRGLELTLDDFWVKASDASNFAAAARTVFPADVTRFARARQRSGVWNWPLARLLTLPVLFISALAFAWLRVRRLSVPTELLVMVGALVVVNALVMSCLSGVEPGRYFSRMNGLLFLACACLVLSALRAFRPRPAQP